MQRVLAQSPFKAGAPRLPNLSNSMAAAAASSLERMEYFMVAKYQHWGTTRWREWLVLALDGAVAFFRHTKQLKANLAICFVNVVVFFRGSRRKGVSHIHNQFFIQIIKAVVRGIITRSLSGRVIGLVIPTNAWSCLIGRALNRCVHEGTT